MAANSLLPVYLIVGDDKLKREFLVKRLNDRIAASGDIDFNRDIFTGQSVEADEVAVSCNMLPFASDYRLVIVEDADKCVKAASGPIISYLAEPNPTTVLVLTATKLAKNTRLYKAVEKVNAKCVVPCETKKAKDLPAQVKQFALSEGMDITNQAAMLLIEMVGEDTVHIDTEIKKVASILGRGKRIDIADIEENVARTAKVKPWDFADALSERNAVKAIALSRRLAVEKRGYISPLYTATDRLRELIVAKTLEEQGRGGTLATYLHQPDWRMRNHRRWAAGFTRRELDEALIAAAQLDQDLKSSTDSMVAFENWIISVCV